MSRIKSEKRTNRSPACTYVVFPVSRPITGTSREREREITHTPDVAINGRLDILEVLGQCEKWLCLSESL